MAVSLRFLTPAAHAGEFRTLGVYDEREIAVEGGVLAPGEVITFLASESVLQRSVVPDVLSNLRDIKRAPKTTRANKAPEPTTMAVTIRAPSSTARASHGRGSS